MDRFVVVLLVVVSLVFGAVVGETYAPISGVTVQTLNAKCDMLEAKIDALAERCERLEAEVKAFSARLKPLGFEL